MSAPSNLDAVIDSWGTREGLSEHARLEISASAELGPGEPVPGCSCPRCVCLSTGGDAEDAELADSLVRQLAEVPPEAREELAGEFVADWEDAGFTLPSSDVLVLLAHREPGARLSAELAGERNQLPVREARMASILDVVRRLGLGVPESTYGREHVVRCPFHDDEDPSLTLNAAENLWYCFPCGEGGDVIRLVEDVREVQFHAAVKWIAENVTARR